MYSNMIYFKNNPNEEQEVYVPRNERETEQI